MLSYKLKNKEINIQENTILSDKVFEELLAVLQNQKVDQLIEVAYRLRWNYQQAKKLYEMAYLLETVDTQKEIIQANIIGLMIQHKKDVRDNIDTSFISGNKEMEFLKGLFFMENGQYEDAEFCFETARFKKGIEMCKVSKNEASHMSKSTNPVVQCYLSSKNWESFEGEVENIDFSFIIGKSTTFKNADNLDVKITVLTNELEKIVKEYKETSTTLKQNSNVEKTYTKSLEDICNKLMLLCNTYNPSAYLLYLIGKVYHIQKNLDMAEDYYNKALMVESDYLPAVFNLCRIKQLCVDIKIKNTDVHDFNALISLKKSNFDFDTSGCTDFVRKLYRATVRSRRLDKSVIPDLENLKEYFKEVEVVNNLCIIKQDKESISMLERLLEKADPIYKEFILYNLGIMKNDHTVLESCTLPEAEHQLDYLRKNIKTTNNNLSTFISNDVELCEDDAFGHVFAGFLYIEECFKVLYRLNGNTDLNNKECISTKRFKTNIDELESGLLDKKGQKIDNFIATNTSNNVYGNNNNSSIIDTEHESKKPISNKKLIYTNINKSLDPELEEYLIKAECSLLKEPQSLYSINGLGICSVIRGDIGLAVQLFQQICDEDHLICKNLANCYLLENNYKKAISYYVKGLSHSLTSKDKEILRHLGLKSKDTKMISHLVTLGISNLENTLANVFLENGEIQKAKELNITNPEIMQRVNESIKKYEDRKRKILEIEEYRNSRK